MICEPVNHTALEEWMRLQISEHVGRRELSCEAESLAGGRAVGTYPCGERDVCETMTLKQCFALGLALQYVDRVIMYIQYQFKMTTFQYCAE